MSPRLKARIAYVLSALNICTTSFALIFTLVFWYGVQFKNTDSHSMSVKMLNEMYVPLFMSVAAVLVATIGYTRWIASKIENWGPVYKFRLSLLLLVEAHTATFLSVTATAYISAFGSLFDEAQVDETGLFLVISWIIKAFCIFATFMVLDRVKILRTSAEQLEREAKRFVLALRQGQPHALEKESAWNRIGIFHVGSDSIAPRAWRMFEPER